MGNFHDLKQAFGVLLVKSKSINDISDSWQNKRDVRRYDKRNIFMPRLVNSQFKFFCVFHLCFLLGFINFGSNNYYINLVFVECTAK
jgi:hypothetical protein